MPGHEPITISQKRFSGMFAESKNQDTRFCFILGSGASVTSGIKSGISMAREWIKDIRAVYSDSEIAEDINNLKIENKNLLDRNYEPASEDYFDIYKLKFYPNYDDGYFYLEKAMENAHPGFGYCHLANILADTRHNLVITTNFDSLTEDALFVYTDKKPIVVGHESLADYARINSSRPVIAKINRGLSLTR